MSIITHFFKLHKNYSLISIIMLTPPRSVSCLVFVLSQGKTKLEFVNTKHHYPGAYKTDGRVILEGGRPVSNELHRTEEQKERTRT